MNSFRMQEAFPGEQYDRPSDWGLQSDFPFLKVITPTYLSGMNVSGLTGELTEELIGRTTAFKTAGSIGG